MFRRLLIFLSVLLIGIQIPLIIILSGASTVASKIAKLEGGFQSVATGVAGKVAAPVKMVGGFVGFAGKETATPLAAVNMVKNGIQQGVSSIFAAGQKDVSQVKNVLGKIINSMYISIVITLLLIIMLILLNLGAFFKNLGAAFILGGVLSIINSILLYYFFNFHFNEIFTFFYQMTATKSSVLGFPLISSLIKSLSRDYVLTTVNILVVRSAIVGAITLGAGIVARFINRLFGTR